MRIAQHLTILSREALEPHVQSSRAKRAREKCAYARVQAGVASTLSVAFMAVATVWTRYCQKKTVEKTQLLQDNTRIQNSQVHLDKVETFRSRRTVSRGHCERESDIVFLHHWSDHVSSCHPYECHFCQLWSQDDELHHVGLGDQLEDDDMVVGVLNFAVPLSAPPNEDSTIQGTFLANDRVCCCDASFHLLA